MTAILTTEATTVSVRGSAALEVAPDYATISFSVEETAAKSQTSLGRASRAADAVRDSLNEARGVRSSGLGRVRVRERTRWDKKREVYVSDGYSATVAGSAAVTVSDVGAVVSDLVAAGASIGWVGWLINDDNPAYREVRKLAVADAHRAAEDFAAAVGAQLGPLATLADPGLLGAGEPHSPDVVSSHSASYDAPAEEDEIDLDPEPQEVFARVEACFQLT